MMPKYTFLLTIIAVVLAGTLLNAQDQPLRFDGGVLELVEIVTKNTESPRSPKISAVPSKQLKPAHDVWQQWEKLKSAEKSSQSTVNADTPLAELKRLAEEGHKDALNMLQTRLRQMIVDKNTSSIMLTALAKIGHTDALRILQEQEKQKQLEDEKRKQEEEEAKRKQREEDERKQKEKEEKAKIEQEKKEAIAAAQRERDQQAQIVQEKAKAVEAEKLREQAAELERNKAVDLREWIKDNDGWKEDRLSILYMILKYGTKELQNDLAMATNDKNAADIKSAEKNIKSRQREIAAKKFYCDIGFRLRDQQSGSSQATVEIILPDYGRDILNWYHLYSFNRLVRKLKD